MSIASHFKTLRERKSLTQDELAEELNTTQGTVSRTESGKAAALVKYEDWAEFFGFRLALVPLETSAERESILAVLDDLDPRKLKDLADLVEGFSSAPLWAQTAALEILRNARQQAGSKSA